MSKDIIELLDGLERDSKKRPLTMEQIKAAEEKLGLKFADDYVKYLLNFGAFSSSAIELTTITDFVGDSVLHYTLKEREYDDTTPLDMYVIEDIGMDGILTWQHESGAVYYKYPYNEELQKTADSLAEYVEKVVSEFEEFEDDDE